MPANVYECMFLLDTAKVASDIPAAAEQLHNLLHKQQAEILASRPWDERRLAYPIGHHKKGLYYLTYFRVESTKIPEMEREFHLNEMIIRFMVVRIDPKLVETMLALARDEHALVALHNYQEETPEEGDQGGERRGRREGGREGGRRFERVGAEGDGAE